MLTIPSPTKEQFFRFRFKDSNVKREGCIVPISNEPSPKQERRWGKCHEWRNKKHNEMIKGDRALMSWCILCPNQADIILLYKNLGCLVREAYCQNCTDKQIIKL